MKEILKRGLSHFGVNYDAGVLEQFEIYAKLLVEWNNKINLTAITETEEIAKKHFVDSASGASWLGNGISLADVGTGAGFPGIPLKIVREDISVTLIDSLAKRVDFLNCVIKELGLKDITAIHSRAEDAGINPLYREKFDVATARAVANLRVLSEYCLPFVKKGGIFISYKGPDCQEEILEAGNAFKTLGGIFREKQDVSFEENSHTLIIIDKTQSTPPKYPRKAGKPSKEPL